MIRQALAQRAVEFAGEPTGFDLEPVGVMIAIALVLLLFWRPVHAFLGFFVLAGFWITIQGGWWLGLPVAIAAGCCMWWLREG